MTSLTKPTKIVIDSNVWISALVFGGTPMQVFESAVLRKSTIMVSAELVTEIRRTLARKFPDFIEGFKILLLTLEKYIQFVWLGEITIRVARDPDDDKILETAVLGKAKFIISGDKDLLVLKKFKRITILKPAEWLAI